MRSITEWAIAAAICVWFLFVVGVLNLGHYQPARATSTVEQLVAELPRTYKFAVVEQWGRSYVVWIGMMRGEIVSGPPVYVFNRPGVIVDRVFDAGDSDNKFAGVLYNAAFHAPGITPQQAVDYCRKWRAASR